MLLVRETETCHNAAAMEGSQSSISHAPEAFAPTNWAIVNAAAGPDEEAARSALAELCRTYWYPLYAFIRRRGYAVEDAQDLTQGFFEHLLEREVFRQADRVKGRFRAFLLTAVQNYLVTHIEHGKTWKRGGRTGFLPLEGETMVELRYLRDTSVEGSPEAVFESRWAATVLTRALAALRAEFVGERRQHLFAALEPFVTISGDSPRYGEVANSLHITPGTLKTMVHRLRQRYRICLRQEIGRTVSSAAEIDDEIRHLCSVLRHGSVLEIG